MTLRIDRHEAAWIFTLDRPDKRNALSAELVEALTDGVARAHREGARVIAFRGEGKNFSAGFDFTDVEATSEGDLLLRFARIEMLLQSIAASPCLTMALAHGRNFGAGVDLFAACRLRLATSEATFRMPGLKFGLVLGTRRFGEIVGRERAAAILLESRTFDGREAQAIGFVERVVEPDAWDGEVARSLAAASALSDADRASLYRVLVEERGDTDLAELVRSAARPGLKQRIAAYLGAS